MLTLSLSTVSVSLLMLLLGIANAELPMNYGSCTAPNGDAGVCVHIQDCPYLFTILTAAMTTPVQRKLLSDSQCGLDNTRTAMVERILACCPSSECKNRTKAEATGQEPGNVLPSIGDCGTLLENRIFGGTKTKIYEFPWMALLQYKKPQNTYNFHCGGALINSRYVLTAGHCVLSPKMPKDWILHSVRLGEWDTTKSPDCVDEINGKRTCAPPHVDIEIEKRIVHEQYLPHSIDQMNDIALLRLKSAPTYTDYVRPICLPVNDELRTKEWVDHAMDVSGWGLTEENKPSAIKLKASVDGWAIKKCQEKYSLYQTHVNQSQICAGGHGGIDTCNGDSGGPLMATNRAGDQDIFFAVGITSYGPTPCGLPGWPGVYTRVGPFVDWIQQKLLP